MNNGSEVRRRTYHLLWADVHEIDVAPHSETGLRSRTVHHFAAGTGTTRETRDFAQTSVPDRVAVEWRARAGATGGYEVQNPPPGGHRRSSWTAWGAGLGAAAGAFIGQHVGRNLAGTTGWGAEMTENAGRVIGGGLGMVAGAGLGAVAGYFAAPTQRYDAGHMIPRQLGGAGHSETNIFGQNPQINRGNRLNGTSTYDMHRRPENEMTQQIKQGGGGRVTYTLFK